MLEGPGPLTEVEEGVVRAVLEDGVEDLGVGGREVGPGRVGHG